MSYKVIQMNQKAVDTFDQAFLISDVCSSQIPVSA